jgi:hypothetical protein
VSPPRATATGGAWVHAPPQENPGNQGGLKRLLTFLADGDLHNTKKHNKQLILSFPSLSSDLLLSFFISAESGAGFHCTHRRQTKHVDGWIGDFLPPTLFLLQRCRPPLPWLGDHCPWSLGFLLLL